MQRTFRQLIAFAQGHPRMALLRALVVAILLYVFIVKRIFWTPDTLFIAFAILFVVFGQAKAFVIRFLPFMSLLVIYDSFRGLADNLNKSVHFTPMITADKWPFHGTLPTTWLQQHLWHGHVLWYDFYFYFLYTIHFVMPVALAILIWKKRDEVYWPFVVALVGLSFMAFVTYIVFPAAPPWMAAEHGLIGVHHISSEIWAVMGVENFSEVYSKLSPNEVAAVPSLHAAYPTLFILFLAKLFGWRKMWWVALYPLSLWFGVVYLGEHYVIDVLLGILYAVLAYAGSMQLFAWRGRYKEFWGKFKSFIIGRKPA
jgi:PAP2 superfamily